MQCFTLRDNTERPVTCVAGTNVLLGLAPELIRTIPSLLTQKTARGSVPDLWDAHAAERLVDVLRGLDGYATLAAAA